MEGKLVYSLTYCYLKLFLNKYFNDNILFGSRIWCLVGWCEVVGHLIILKTRTLK